MYQRRICPSMGVIRRPLAREIASISNCAQRSSFHVTTRQSADEPSSAAPKPTPNPSRSNGSSPPRSNLRIRSATAFQRLKTLPQALKSDAKAAGPTASGRPPPPGKLVRAPATLRLQKKPGDQQVAVSRSNFGNQNPRPRRDVKEGEGNGPRRGPGNRRGKEKSDRAPRPKREKPEEAKMEDSLTDGMVQQLLRLQKKEWDPVPYEPVYSKKDNLDDLVTLSQGLFKGQPPEQKKKPGRLEYVLGIQNMHGA